MPLGAHLIDGELALAEFRVSSRAGLVATAAWDEDAVTLAARAGLAVLDRHPEVRPRALVAATVSPPLPEPGIVPYLAEVFDVQGSGALTGERGGSVAAGAGAVTDALALVAAGIDPVLVVAADTRRDAKGRALGDGAVALLLGSAGDAGAVAHAGADVELFVDRWRRRGAAGIEAGDRSLDSFGPARAFTAALTDEGTAATIATRADGPVLPRAGFLGCAAPLAGLLTADVEAGGRVLVTASAGGVSHGFRFEAGRSFQDVADRARAELAGGGERSPGPAPDEASFHPFTSQAEARRERGTTFRLEAKRDPATGEVVYPPPPAAVAAGLEPVRLGRTGTVHTFARDHVFPMGGPLTMAVVSLDGGGRFYGQVAGGGGVAIGERVRLELRRIHSGGGLPHYFWKVSPMRKEG